MMGFEIQKAERGGYFVSLINRRDGMYRDIMFAGTLDECLAFIRNEFEKEGEAK